LWLLSSKSLGSSPYRASSAPAYENQGRENVVDGPVNTVESARKTLWAYGDSEDGEYIQPSDSSSTTARIADSDSSHQAGTSTLAESAIILCPSPLE
jgi:hypothetical protein